MSAALPEPSLHLIPSLAQPRSHDRDGHVVQLYTDDVFLIDVLSRFIGGAIAMGDAAVVLATKAHHEGLARRLSAQGLDTAKAIRQGRYVLLDAAETLSKFIVNGSVDETRFIDLIGGTLTGVCNASNRKDSRIAVFGELVALLWAEGKPQEAIRVEQLWNALAQKHSFSLLCAYPITGFNNERHIDPFLRMCDEHSGVVPSESYLGLGSEEERLRSIAHLQQKAQALQKELESRVSEERFRLLVDAVQDYAIFMLDPKGNVTSWNSGAERLKGYKANEIIGKHFSSFYPEEDLRNHKPQWELTVAEKDGRFEDEGWRLRKDGSRFWANVIITAVRDESGRLVGFGKVTRDFTERMRVQQALQKEVVERKETEQRLHDSERSLRDLSIYLLRSQDEERRRIGRDLHDSLGQYLAVLKMKLDLLASGQREGQIAQELGQCVSLTEDSIREVRTLSHLLYPPMLEETGLTAAIPWFLDGFSSRSGIQTTFEVDPVFDRLPREAELAMFRVLQESLTNVHRHSGSRIAHVRLLSKDGTAILEVADEGKGVPPGILKEAGEDWTRALGVGLRGMNERMRQLGGTLRLTSSEAGTTVSASVPIRPVHE
jgi:PAS domain S-box-containing protein